MKAGLGALRPEKKQNVPLKKEAGPRGRNKRNITRPGGLWIHTHTHTPKCPLSLSPWELETAFYLGWSDPRLFFTYRNQHFIVLFHVPIANFLPLSHLCPFFFGEVYGNIFELIFDLEEKIRTKNRTRRAEHGTLGWSQWSNFLAIPRSSFKQTLDVTADKAVADEPFSLSHIRTPSCHRKTSAIVQARSLWSLCTHTAWYFGL